MGGWKVLYYCVYKLPGSVITCEDPLQGKDLFGLVGSEVTDWLHCFWASGEVEHRNERT